MIRIAILVLTLFPTLAFAQIHTISVYATGAQSHKTWHGQADVQALNVELAHALSPRTDIGVVFAPMNFWQPRSWFGDQFGDGNESVRALSASLLVRRRFNASSRLQFYGEASTGPLWAEKAVPASTSRFNFNTQFGAGVVLMPNARFPLMAGYRYMHISNGGYSPRNPGLNVSGVVLGVRMRRR
ncbi:MAG TPA: acyloxyacyl hydrolase [Thermoanaerobaculia bacterium]|nr:acyloxyacyl hydrolase [Thermoanaerobaculia bacterium]